LAYFQTDHKNGAVHTPRERESFTPHIELVRTCPTLHIPKADCAISAAACKLELFDGIEEDLLNRVRVTFKLDLRLWVCALRVPDADRFVGGAGRNEGAGVVP